MNPKNYFLTFREFIKYASLGQSLFWDILVFTLFSIKPVKLVCKYFGVILFELILDQTKTCVHIAEEASRLCV